MVGRVVIVGGGYVGAELAQMLDAVTHVTLVEQREAFSHAPAMIRSVVRPELVERALIPYNRLLRNGDVVRARASAVGGSGVMLEDGRRFEADVIVVATGSRHSAAFKPSGSSVQGLRDASRALHDHVQAAGSIAIVGGGALGTELAGEIKAARPDKTVTLVSDTPLVAGYPPRLGQNLVRKLRTLGVDISFGQQAVDMQSAREPFAGALTLEDGRTISADLVIPALGSQPDTSLLDALPGVRKGADGRVQTDRWMRPSDLPNVFAAGDAADNGDPMTIVGASRQVPWLARAVRGVLKGRRLDRTPAYAPWRKPPLLVPLGAHMGSSFLPVIGVVGNGPTRKIKGKDLFLPKYHKLFRTGA